MRMFIDVVSGDCLSAQKKMNVLDFIISVLKIHEKELDNKINRLETNIEHIENLMRAMQALLLQERSEDERLHIREMLIEVLETPFSL
jgi:predicted RNase H-like nuclease (RuvC/YqgF family)